MAAKRGVNFVRAAPVEQPDSARPHRSLRPWLKANLQPEPAVGSGPYAEDDGGRPGAAATLPAYTAKPHISAASDVQIGGG
jgi:hypothetical protein